MLGQHLRRIIDALPSIIDLRQNPKRGLTRARSSSSIPYPLTLNDFRGQSDIPELLMGDILALRLRLTVFRDWPYLYDGDLDYERA